MLNTTKIVKNVSTISFGIFCCAIFSLVSIIGPSLTFAASKEEKTDVLRRSEYHDGSEAGISECGSGVVSLSVDKNLNLGADGLQRRVNLTKLLISDLSLTPEQAAGIVGNFMVEATPEILSGINQGQTTNAPPTSDYSSGNAYGWAQWDGGRKRAFIDFAIQAGYMADENSIATDGANYAYLKKELSEGEGRVLPVLRATTSATEAARVWDDLYERSSSFGNRGVNAEQVLSEYNSSGGGASISPSSCFSPLQVGEAKLDTSKKDTFTGELMENPTGIVLHWTAGSAGSTVDEFISQIKSNNACGDGGCSVQFYVKGDGTIYQLVDPINTKTSHAAGANSCCIGIEIGGRGAEDLLGNDSQKQAVVNLVAALIDKFQMKIDPDIATLSGILSHHITPMGVQNGKTDVSDEYHRQILESIRAKSSGSPNP